MHSLSARRTAPASIRRPAILPVTDDGNMAATVLLKGLGMQLVRRLSRRGDLLDALLWPFKAADGSSGRSLMGRRRPLDSRSSSAYLPYFCGLPRSHAVQAIRLGASARHIHAGTDSAYSTHCAVHQLLDLATEMAATGGSMSAAMRGMTAQAQQRFSQAFAALTMHDIRSHTTAARAELSRAMAGLGVPAQQHSVLQSCGISDAAHGQERLRAVRRFASAMAADAGVQDPAATPCDPLDFAWQVVRLAGQVLHGPDAPLPTVTLQPPQDGAPAMLYRPASVLSVRPAGRFEMICAIFHEMVHSTQHRWIDILDLDHEALPAHQRDFATLARLSSAGATQFHAHAHRWQSQGERDAWACEQMLVIALARETAFSAALSPVVRGIPLDSRCIDDVHDRVAAQIGLWIDQPLPQSVCTRQWRHLLQALRKLDLMLVGPELRLWFDVIATRAGLLRQPSPKHAQALLTALAGAMESPRQFSA